MSAKSRLNRVQRHLSPKQLVLIEVRESRRRYATFIDYGRAAALRDLPAPDLMEQIEASVVATARGVDERTRVKMIREAQREGMFLARLATECASALVDVERELELMTGFLMVYRLTISDHIAELPEDSLITWLKGALDHRLRMLVLLAAVRLIEEEYFDGAQIMFRASQEHLDRNLEQISKLIAALSDLTVEVMDAVEKDAGIATLDKQEIREFLSQLRADPAPAEHEVQAGARRQAKDWVTLVRAAVLDAFGFRGQAQREAAAIFKDEDEAAHLLPNASRG